MREITIKEETVLTVLEHKGPLELIRPLQNEIFLYETEIAGTTYIEDSDQFINLKQNEKLTLRRARSRFDSYGIVILNSEERKLGYVPERDTPVLSRLMDAGKIHGLPAFMHG